MNKVARKRGLSSVRRLKSMYRGLKICGTLPLLMERKKVMKQEREESEKNSLLRIYPLIFRTRRLSTPK